MELWGGAAERLLFCFIWFSVLFRLVDVLSLYLSARAIRGLA